MKRTITLFVLFMCFAWKISKQSTLQTVRGTVFERETQFPLPGATIVILKARSAKVITLPTCLTTGINLWHY